MAQRHLTSIAAIGATCAVLGAAVLGVSSGMAASPSSAADSTPGTSRPTGGPARPGHGGMGGPHGGMGGPHGGMGGPERGAIHSETVRADPDGTGFITIVVDAGTVTAIDGTTLTVKQGTARETFDTVDVVIDGTVTVMRNGAASDLSAIKVGDGVRVMKDGTNTRVHASTAAFDKARAAEHADAQATEAAGMTRPSA